MAPPKQKAAKGRASKPASTITDPRFANIHSDPRFRLPSKKNTRVTVDKRFAHMLKDDDFARKATVDRYGRKLAKDSGKKELKRMYRMEDEDEDGEEDGEKDDEVSDEADDDEEVQEELARMDRKYDPAREGGFSSSEDESDEDEDEEEDVDEEDVVEFPSGGREAEVETGEVTARLAVVNLDWDNIRSEDLMAVASSFTPPEGRIVKVTVYPSEFGRERMEREELEGPPPEIFAKNKKGKKDADSSSDSEEDSEEEDEKIKKDLLQEDRGEEFDSKALRQYQLERLRYYYAVITADSPETAKHIYENMDGREYLTSANFFDLRFVPDEVSFDEDKPRDECESIPDGYRPNEFVTDALTHSRVKLTWDADDTQRKEVQKRAFSQKEIDDNDLRAYIGSDSSDESEDDASESEAGGEDEKEKKRQAKEEKAAKLRAALGLDSGLPVTKKSRDKPVGDMEITFTPGLSTSEKKKASVFENEPDNEETTKEKYLRKERERKERRKERAKARRLGLNPDDPAALEQARESLKQQKQQQKDSGSEEEEEVADGGAASDDDDNDDPWNDPFFENPEVERKRARKEAKRLEATRKREERAAKEAASAAERAQLELLMADEDGESRRLQHFDMNEIEKAEKKKKKGKKGKKDKKKAGKDDEGGEDAELQKGFKMDTQDPRFAALFESHEFAIDPTNPRFKSTPGMKALLEEGRKKRKMGSRGGAGGAPEEVPDERGAKKAKKAKQADAGDADDLKKLVERVKSKTKKNKA